MDSVGREVCTNSTFLQDSTQQRNYGQGSFFWPVNVITPSPAPPHVLLPEELPAITQVSRLSPTDQYWQSPTSKIC
jgi:hypothetical protein